MVLLDNVVHRLVLPDADGRFPFSMDCLQGGQIGTTFVHGDRLGDPIFFDSLLEVTMHHSLVAIASQQKVEDLTCLVQCPIPVLRLTLDLDVRFIHPPAFADRTFVLAKGLFEQWQEPDHPAMHRRMVNLKSTLNDHFLQIALAQ